MTDTEMDDLALLWAGAVEPQEERLVETLARRVSWRGRLLQYADIGGAVALAGGIAIVVLRDGGDVTALSGLLLVLAISWQTWKRNTLWDAEMSAVTDRQVLLTNAARAAEARLKRMEISLLLLVPVALLTVWFALALYGSEVSGLHGALVEALERPAATLLYAATVIALGAYMLISRKRTRAELERIAEIGRQYGDEARLDRIP